jgi:riboflavin kinase/FMN adenylyltransferase
MEIHFFYDRLDNLYGEEIRVEFLDRVRDEIKFPTPKDLVLQLKKDKKYCLSIMNKYN